MYTPWSLRTRKIWLHNDVVQTPLPKKSKLSLISFLFSPRWMSMYLLPIIRDMHHWILMIAPVMKKMSWSCKRTFQKNTRICSFYISRKYTNIYKWNNTTPVRLRCLENHLWVIWNTIIWKILPVTVNSRLCMITSKCQILSDIFCET